MKSFEKILFSIAPALLVLFADQASKLYIKINFIRDLSNPILGHYLRVTYIENPGLAFGLSVGSFAWLLFLVTIIITLYIIYYLLFINDIHDYEILALSFILGGALGNLVDWGFSLFSLFNYAGVIDFIDIGLFEYSFRYPYIFNIADLSVTVGICIYFIASITKKRENNISKKFINEESHEVT